MIVVGGYSVINTEARKNGLDVTKEPTPPTPTPLVDEPEVPPVSNPPQVG